MPYAGSYDIPAITDGNDEKLPQNRVRDGWHGHAIFRKLEYDDRDAEVGRACIDQQIDGVPPWSRKVMEDAGRGEDANVNFREARAEDDLAQTPFIEMGTVSKILWRVKTNFSPQEQDNKKWSSTISEMFTKMVRKWGAFNYYRQRAGQQFTRHGAAFAYWEDETDWRWRADGFSAFKLPRDTESRADAIPYCICKRSMSVTDLYSFIRKEEQAKDAGHWNVEAVKIALRYAAISNSRPLYSYAWEDFQREIKENDVEFGVRAEKIQLYHLWCEEYDGSISHYIGLQDGVAMLMTEQPGEKPFKSQKYDEKGNPKRSEGENGKYEEPPKQMAGNGFLFAHRFRFPKFLSSIVPFFYCIGTQGTIHTIRGQGEMNFAPIQISNRTMCTMLDAIKGSSMILLQAETAMDAEQFAYVQYGPFMLIPQNAKVQPQAMPDVGPRYLPVLNEMRALRARNNPNGQTQGAPSTGKSKQPKTKYQMQSEQNMGGSLNSAMLTQWFDPWTWVGEEMYRRAMNPDLKQDDRGGKEAFEFRKWCMKAGVPAEAMRIENCEIEAVRVIGNGSPEQRQYAAEQVYELSDGFDESGKKQALTDVVASIPGVDYQSAEDYVGAVKLREPIDDQIARLENSDFTQGASCDVTGEQNHWVHFQVHNELAEQFAQSFQQGEIDGEKIVTVLKPALDNMQRHAEYLTKDKSRDKESAQARKIVQNYGGLLEQQENKMIAAMHRQNEQMQPQQGQQQSGDEARAQQAHDLKMKKMQMDMQMRQAQFQQRQQLMQMEARLHMTLASMEAARDMAEKSAEIASAPLQ